MSTYSDKTKVQIHQLKDHPLWVRLVELRSIQGHQYRHLYEKSHKDQNKKENTKVFRDLLKQSFDDLPKSMSDCECFFWLTYVLQDFHITNGPCQKSDWEDVLSLFSQKEVITQTGKAYCEHLFTDSMVLSEIIPPLPLVTLGRVSSLLGKDSFSNAAYWPGWMLQGGIDWMQDENKDFSKSFPVLFKMMLIISAEPFQHVSLLESFIKNQGSSFLKAEPVWECIKETYTKALSSTPSMIRFEEDLIEFNDWFNAKFTQEKLKNGLPQSICAPISPRL